MGAVKWTTQIDDLAEVAANLKFKGKGWGLRFIFNIKGVNMKGFLLSTEGVLYFLFSQHL